MALGHLGPRKPRPFKPTNKGGGSKKGKPQKRWPPFIKMVAEAVVIRAKGSEEAFCADRNAPFSRVMFEALMEKMLPGLWAACPVIQGPRKTPYRELLYNRPYKMYYSGGSDRPGQKHDPMTRACVSREHWRKFIPQGSAAYQIHEGIIRGTVTSIPDWKKYLP